MSMTEARKKTFASHVLRDLKGKIGFLDVGSGGELKTPWSLLPVQTIEKFDIDPETDRKSELPICISDTNMERPFYLAIDRRASSLHKPSQEFISRFALPTMEIEKEIRVNCQTLDSYLSTFEKPIDIVDVNTEGHDYQVLCGAQNILTKNFIKILKVEYELVEVWQGQGWFSDIDQLLRKLGFRLVRMENECIRPAVVKDFYHLGEPAWGKALYVPSQVTFDRHLENHAQEAKKDEVLKCIALYTILDLPAQAIELLSSKSVASLFSSAEQSNLIYNIKWVYKFARFDVIKEKFNNGVGFFTRQYKNLTNREQSLR